MKHFSISLAVALAFSVPLAAAAPAGAAGGFYLNLPGTTQGTLKGGSPHHCIGSIPITVTPSSAAPGGQVMVTVAGTGESEAGPPATVTFAKRPSSDASCTTDEPIVKISGYSFSTSVPQDICTKPVEGWLVVVTGTKSSLGGGAFTPVCPSPKPSREK